MSEVRQYQISISIGEAWRGFEWVTVKKYKRKEGFLVQYLCKTWRGNVFTTKKVRCRTVEEVYNEIKWIGEEEVRQKLQEAGWLQKEVRA